MNIIELGLKNGDTIRIEIYSKQSYRKNDSYKNREETKKLTVITFPNLKENINIKFAIYFRILKLIYNQLEAKEAISKRQIYYMDVKLFKKQAIVDRVIDIIANSLNLNIEQLNVHASQKGLVCANLQFSSTKFGNYQIFNDNMSSLIPAIPTFATTDDFQITFNNSIYENPKQIIIMEKDAILSALLAKNKTNQDSMFKRSILLSGRGFPDRSTKNFVKLVCQKFGNIPVMGFFDADIYGFMIFKEYKSKPFDQSKESCCEHLQYNGAMIFPKVMKNNKRLDFLPLTEADIKVSLSQMNSLSLTKREEINEISEAVKQIQRSLFLCVKRELQVEDILAVLNI